MRQPLRIEFRNSPPVPDVEQRIHHELAELEKFYNRLVSCRVRVEFPEHARRGSQSRVQLELHVPAEDAATPARLRGGRIESDGTERLEIEERHKEPRLAAHEAFTTARRRLDEFTGRRHEIA